MAVRIAKVQAFNRCIRNVVIRYVVPDLVPAIIAEVQGTRDRMELHSNDVPDACKSPVIKYDATACSQAHWQATSGMLSKLQ